MIQQNINAYNEDEFRKEFADTDIYKQLSQDFDEISFDNTVVWDWAPTPRQRLASSRKSVFSAVSFYYLNFLTQHNPDVIYDLGCGANYFKQYIPIIVGIGEEPPENKFFSGDIAGRFDQQWLEENQGRINSIFAICSLHFVSISQMRQRVLDLASTLTPGGRAYIALNASRMCESMWQPWIKWKNPSHYEPVEQQLFDQDADVATVDRVIREQLSDMPFTYEVFDVNIGESGHRNQRHDYRPRFDNAIDGNVRMVIWNNKI